MGGVAVSAKADGTTITTSVYTDETGSYYFPPLPPGKYQLRIGAHDPHTLPLWEYYKQVFWSSGIDIDNEGFATLAEEGTLEMLELPAGDKAVLSLQLPKAFIIVFEPVTHSAHFIDVQGEPTKERQQLSLMYNNVHAPTGTTTMRPGPLRLSLDNQSGTRVLPSVFIAAEGLHHLIGKRKPFLTAKRMLSTRCAAPAPSSATNSASIRRPPCASWSPRSSRTRPVSARAPPSRSWIHLGPLRPHRLRSRVPRS